MSNFKLPKETILVLLLLLIGGFLRFYNLLWGGPFYFHPDERNIVYSISQLSFPFQMNPHFFAYGSLPIYIVYFVSNFSSIILKTPNDFSFIIFWLRFFSASLSCLIILSLYIISRKLISKPVALFITFLATFSAGLIQYAHFGTFEIWITFFSLWLFYFCVKIEQKTTKKYIALAAIIIGLLIAIKISNVTLIIFPLLCLLLSFIKSNKAAKQFFFIRLVIFFLISLAVYFISNPYVFFDFKDFSSSIQYESSVALGSLPVFYTGSFFDTIPILFQFLYVYPFLINPLLTLFFIPAFFVITLQGIRQKNSLFLLLISYFLLLFLSQAFLFVKWTRYIVPTIPFVYIILALGINHLFSYHKKLLYILCCVISIFFTFAFFKTVYFSPDTRINAAEWTQNNISPNDPVITEPYDLGILPFNPLFRNIIQVPFYDIDANTQALSAFKKDIQNGQVLILPSQRLIHSRILHKSIFPEGNILYTDLLTNKTIYKLVYKTPCDIFCTITYMGNPLYNVEETVTVFDRPTVMIFQKK